MKILKASPRAVADTVAALKRGEVVVVPTDTVYGFIADAANKKAVDRIYQIKKRPKAKKLPVFVSNLAAAKVLAEVDVEQEKLLRKRWPGKYTFVLKRKGKVKLYGVDTKTIAVRQPKHRFLQKVMDELGRPLVQTSVNVSGQETITSIKVILGAFGKSPRIGLIIDGGSIKRGKSSTVIDITTSKHTILRK